MSKRVNPVCFSLSEKDLRRLDKLAKERTLNRSETVRLLVRSKRLKPQKTIGILGL